MENQTMELEKRIELEEWQLKITNQCTTLQSPLLKSEQRLIDTISKNPTIRTLLKILPEQEFEKKFKDLLSIIVSLSGVKTKVDQITMGLLFAYFKNYLIGYSLQDITLAFMMNAANEFDEKVQHFDLLDVNFVSDVMAQFLKQKTAALKRLQMLMPKEETKTVTAEESYNGLKKYIKENKSFPEFWAWSQVYLHMDMKKMFKENNDQKREMYQKEVTRLKSKFELDALDIKDSLERTRRSEEIPDIAIVNCRKAMIEKYLMPKSRKNP